MNDAARLREELAKAKAAMLDELMNHPPTIGLVGVSGTGKSSTINAIFGTKRPVSDVVACTKEFSNTDFAAVLKEQHMGRQRTVLRVVDAPGLGEDLQRDDEYLEMYHQHLSQCDVILWVLAARNRAIALDQMYLQKLSAFHGKMVFGINQVDLVEPMDWARTNLPSEAQKENIAIIAGDRAKKLATVLGSLPVVVPYSARRRFNLPELFRHIIDACPAQRAWIFDGLKDFTAYSGIPEDVRDEVRRIVERREGARRRGTTQGKKSGLLSMFVR